jgi:hypothetical protein
MAENVSKRFGIFPGRARGVKVDLKGNPPPAYVYEDDNLRLEIPVPPLDVFLAFVRELDKLGAEDADVEKYVTTLARAFWLLHQRPRKRGLFRKKYFVPDIDEACALTFLNVVFPDLENVAKSLPEALFGLVKHVTTGPKKEE